MKSYFGCVSSVTASGWSWHSDCCYFVNHLLKTRIRWPNSASDGFPKLVARLNSHELRYVRKNCYFNLRNIGIIHVFCDFWEIYALFFTMTIFRFYRLYDLLILKNLNSNDLSIYRKWYIVKIKFYIIVNCNYIYNNHLQLTHISRLAKTRLKFA